MNLKTQIHTQTTQINDGKGQDGIDVWFEQNAYKQVHLCSHDFHKGGI